MKLTSTQESILKRTFIDFHSTAQFIHDPLIMNRAEGLYYWDIEGKRYFDAIGGIFVASLGHRHPRIVDAVKRQLDRITFAPPLHSITDVAMGYIEKLGLITPGNLKYVKPFCGGSEAVESALKYVRQFYKQTGHPEKYKNITRYNAYHGATFAATSAGGSVNRKIKCEPHMPGFLKVPTPTYLRDRFSSWDECNVFAAKMVEDCIINENPETVAAVLLEPIGNIGGVITPTQEYLKLIRQICDKYNVKLIFDEVITTFKTGSMFAAQTFEVTPDIICGGKGLASGVIPLSAMIARDDMSQAFFSAEQENMEFAHGHTFAGNPLACAAGIAVIDEIVEKKLIEKSQKTGSYLFNLLESLKKYGVVREVRGKGIWLGVELVKDTRTNAPFPELGKALKKTALQNGIIMRIEPDWFSVAPALIAQQQDIDEMFSLIDKSIADALAIANSKN